VGDYGRRAGIKDATVTLALDGNVTLKLALIPAGKFLMGSPRDEKDRRDYEGPRHEVTISKPFYMGVLAVTQEQYERVMGKNPSTFKGAQNPVETLYWDDAVEFCLRLSMKTGHAVRLPTEAEWEYACRAGSKGRFSFGDDDGRLGDYAWYLRNSDLKTHPVGQKKPNDWGLYDMHGNVWQWCGDWYAGARALDPKGPASGALRVLRGSGWTDPAFLCRSAFRGRASPDGRCDFVGFRVVVELK
jgi:formylglycine-generating enzyme required for sulfatase activity